MSAAPSAASTIDPRDQLPTSRPPRPLPDPDPSVIPAFVLIAPPPRTHPRTKVTAPSLCAAWRDALAADDVPAEVAARFTVKEAKLDPAALAEEFGECACVVSPANAFGIMDGGYDMALSVAFTVERDIWALTNVVQDALRTQYRGYLPPGACELVPLTPALTASNPLGCTVLAVVPTMRTPEDVSWHVDLVYDCMWNLLSALWRWNNGDRPEGAARVERVLMTGLGTGNGGITYERCARQMALAAVNFARGWGERPRWDDVEPRAKEMDATRRV
ncbi:macro domain-like protein [Trametes versicolor FP-101664 SS1]|uniref:macro domain-like protein n=1 Tax=Trametes versicolor (strain FP-101664) TaxID=717944 RepID=UPI0004624093|nr:macro domain-like protein [Trametes versicolor FP-101664 SS1]EIW59209.1 macro domain-like protein [Trametes versicolor FP-101664 SS1]